MMMAKRIGAGLSYLFKPIPSKPTDLLKESASFASALSLAGRSIAPLSLIAIGIFLVKLVNIFHGNLSYVFAVVERLSLSQAVLFLAISIGYTAITYAIMFAIALYTSPRYSSRIRNLILIALGIIVLVFVGSIPVFVLVLIPIAYALYNGFTKYTLKKAEKVEGRPLVVDAWAKANLNNADVVLRNYAATAVNASTDEANALVKSIRKRARELAEPTALDRWARLLGAYGITAAQVLIFLTVPLSATYSVVLDGTPKAGYVVGPNDNAIFVPVPTTTLSPRLLTPTEFETRRICPSNQTRSWIFGPLGSATLQPEDIPGCPR